MGSIWQEAWSQLLLTVLTVHAGKAWLNQGRRESITLAKGCRGRKDGWDGSAFKCHPPSLHSTILSRPVSLSDVQEVGSASLRAGFWKALCPFLIWHAALTSYCEQLQLPTVTAASARAHQSCFHGTGCGCPSDLWPHELHLHCTPSSRASCHWWQAIGGGYGRPRLMSEEGLGTSAMWKSSRSPGRWCRDHMEEGPSGLQPPASQPTCQTHEWPRAKREEQWMGAGGSSPGKPRPWPSRCPLSKHKTITEMQKKHGTCFPSQPSLNSWVAGGHLLRKHTCYPASAIALIYSPWLCNGRMAIQRQAGSHETLASWSFGTPKKEVTKVKCLLLSAVVKCVPKVRAFEKKPQCHSAEKWELSREIRWRAQPQEWVHIFSGVLWSEPSSCPLPVTLSDKLWWS